MFIIKYLKDLLHTKRMYEVIKNCSADIDMILDEIDKNKPIVTDILKNLKEQCDRVC